MTRKHPPQGEGNDRALFDTVAPQYAKKDTTPSTSYVRANRLRTALAPLQTKNSRLGVVVDIACGVGAPAQYLKNFYDQYIGIDYSDELIRTAKELYGSLPHVRFIKSNIKNPTLPHNTADCIIAIGALHHMADLDEVFQSLKSIAKPNSHFVAVEPSRTNPFIQLIRWLRQKLDVSYSSEQRYFSAQEIKNILKRNGMQNITVSHEGYCATPFAEVIVKPQAIFYPISRAAAAIDRWLARFLPFPFRLLSWNIIIRATFPPKK